MATPKGWELTPGNNKKSTEWDRFCKLSIHEKRGLIEEIALDVRKLYHGAQFAFITNRYGWRIAYGIFIIGPLRMTEGKRVRASRESRVLLGELHNYQDTYNPGAQEDEDARLEFACWSLVLSHYCLRRPIHPGDAFNVNSH